RTRLGGQHTDGELGVLLDEATQRYRVQQAPHHAPGHLGDVLHALETEHVHFAARALHLVGVPGSQDLAVKLLAAAHPAEHGGAPYAQLLGETADVEALD